MYEGTHKGCPYGGVGARVMAARFGGKGHPQGVPLRVWLGLGHVQCADWERGLGTWWKRHLLGTRRMVGEACCRRGGVAGAEPPHKGGPNRPDRPKAAVSS